MSWGIDHIYVSFCLFVSSMLLACPAYGLPQQPYYAIQSHFISEQWTTNNGLPINHVNQVYQTPDGYIWPCAFLKVENKYLYPLSGQLHVSHHSQLP